MLNNFKQMFIHTHSVLLLLQTWVEPKVLFPFLCISVVCGYLWTQCDVHICVDTHAQAHRCTHLWMHTWRSEVSTDLFCYPPPYVLRQGLPLTLELTLSARLATSWPLQPQHLPTSTCLLPGLQMYVVMSDSCISGNGLNPVLTLVQ